MAEVRVVFYGQVQGVFFRATARDIAQRMNLKGTVKNLPNGSVEVFVQGEEETIEAFILKLTQQFYLDPGQPYKKELSESESAFEDFRIIY